MKNILLALFIAFSSAAFAQRSFHPSLVILSPYAATADQRYDHEIKLASEKLKSAADERVRLEKEFNSALRKEDANIRIMTQKGRKLARSMNFYTNISYAIEQYLQIKIMEKFPDLLIYAVTDKCSGDLEGLRRVPTGNHVQFVINPVEVNSYVENDRKFTKIRFQVYEVTTGAIVWEKEYIGSDKNPGSDFACDEGSIECTVNNALVPAIKDFVPVIFGKKSNAAPATTTAAPATPVK